MKLKVENIPAELHHLKQWVCWKKGTDDKGRVTKIPINPHNGRNAMSNNPDTWSDMMDAVVAASHYDLAGVGFMLTNGYFGIDLDDVSETMRNEFIEQMQSYTEISQSGNGIHIIARGNLPEGPRRKNGVEMYEENRFFVMTGDIIGNYQITDGTDNVVPLFNKYLLGKADKQIVVPETAQVNEPVKLTDNDVLKKAQNAKNGTQFKLLFDGEWETLNYGSQSEADMALCNLLAFWTGRDIEQMDRLFRMSGLYRDKWDRKQSGTTYGRITLQNAANNCQNVYSISHQDEKSITVNAKTGEVSYQRGASYDLNDTGNAQRFVDRYHGYIRYNFENRHWVIWNGKYWGVDITNQIKAYAEVIINDMKIDAFQEEDEKTRKARFMNVERAFSSRGKENLLKEAMHQKDIPCVNDSFDRHAMLLNTFSGVVNLESGELIEHDKELMLKSITPYDVDFKKKPKRWLKFLNEVFLGDQEVIDFVHKAVGYTLTGSIKEQSMFVCHGEGDNGKSVFLDVISRMLGDYSANASVETLLERKGGNTNTSDLARLKGARFVTTGENNEGVRLNEGLIKQMTGGEKITARFLYGTEFEFYPEFKLWLATNHKPIIRGTDHGIWRRIHAIPFKLKVAEKDKDKDLVPKLIEEMPQILGWAINGCLQWQEHGLVQPKTIADATQEYKNEMDTIKTFIDDCINDVDGWETPASDVYKVYEQWARNSNEYVMSLTKFGKELNKRYEKLRRSHGNVYVGLQLKRENPAYVFQKHNVV